MSDGINEAHVRGRAGRDGELKYTGAGQSLLSFSVACSRMIPIEGRPREYREQVDWIDVTAWGGVAESTYVAKGDLVDVVGRLQTRSWDKDDGTKGYRTSVVAQRIQTVEKARERVDAGPGAAPMDDDGPMYETATGRPARGGEVDPDDLPFA